ncbi:hypothetical protein H312_02378 [Anncaliia algerae PRA339]|uniref:ISXO2-like transposase domain-containing protein n=1 Tax=Anncaliia algerae PRA339 TaxID=1288291 RepID=A0A059EYV0_9MICR|nr:hypothetical protein H312_02378 [Anncaliia algerae PRA339]
MERKSKNKKDTLTIFSDIFTKNECAIRFCRENGLFSSSLSCHKCKQGTMELKTYNQSINGLCYRCKFPKCKSRKALSFGFVMGGFKFQYCIILRAVFCYILNFNNFQSANKLGMEKKTFIKIKKIINNKLINYFKNEVLQLGGPGISVQCDETAICNGRIITDPTHKIDETPNTQWILGFIEETTDRKCFLILIPDRKAETFSNIFTKHLKKGTLLKTDGYPSYPKAALISNLDHKIVNHSLGFVSSEGINTNLIECVWGHFKTLYRSKHGLDKKNLIGFIAEFNWKKNFFRDKKMKILMRLSTT